MSLYRKKENEIVKSQRKKMAGKTQKKDKKTSTSSKNTSGGDLEIHDQISVKELAEKTGINAAKIIGELMKNGILANINQVIDFETAQIIAADMGVKIKRIRSAAQAEDLLSGDLDKLITEDDSADLEERPPVICVMGHVDHGKTKLLDTIRNSDVVAGEAGGITQHIGAYMVEKNGKKLAFLDTPGHEAFTAMRARGAKVTDIAILVVAADEGIKPQTVEALNHAKEAGVPIIVAANKIDKPEANLEKLKGELTEHGLQPEDWGGSTIVVPVSALKGDGVDELLEMILLTAEMENLKANPDREAVATVVEAHLDQNLGPVATVLVNTGTLKVTNNFVVGETYGRIKVMKDHHGKSLRTAGPSTPVFIAGLQKTPKSGDILQVVQDEKTARDRASEILLLGKDKNKSNAGGLEQLLSQVKSDKMLKLIVKSDAKGTLEAIKSSLAKIQDKEVSVKVIHEGVGRISESDVMMASASNAMIATFHSDFDSTNVEKMADTMKVEVKNYTVIYDLLEDVKGLMSGLIEPEIIEVVTGRAQVKAIFLTKKKETIIGCKVLKGKVLNGAKFKVLRGVDEDQNDIEVARGMINSLRKVNDVVKEMKEGSECGMKISCKETLKEGDILEVFTEEERRRVIS